MMHSYRQSAALDLYPRHEFMIYSLRKILPVKFTTLAIVIVIHIAAINYLIHARQLRPPEPIATSIKMHIVDDVKADSEKLLPLPLNFEVPATAVTMPDIAIAQERDVTHRLPIMQLATNVALTIDVPIVATTEPRLNPSMENTFPAEEYPLPAKRAGQEGTVTLSLLVLEDGRVDDALIEESSGFDILDQAAARYAQLHWYFVPGTRNGKAVVDWKKVSVVFTLKEVGVRY